MATDAERWTYRFHRDAKSWTRDLKVFVDKGRAMPNRSPALLKTRQYLRRRTAEGMWKDLVRKGWKRVAAVWGPESEPWLVPVLTKGFRPMSNNAYVPENGDASNLGEVWGDLPFLCSEGAF